MNMFDFITIKKLLIQKSIQQWSNVWTSTMFYSIYPFLFNICYYISNGGSFIFFHNENNPKQIFSRNSSSFNNQDIIIIAPKEIYQHEKVKTNLSWHKYLNKNYRTKVQSFLTGSAMIIAKYTTTTSDLDKNV